MLIQSPAKGNPGVEGEVILPRPQQEGPPHKGDFFSVTLKDVETSLIFLATIVQATIEPDFRVTRGMPI